MMDKVKKLIEDGKKVMKEIEEEGKKNDGIELCVNVGFHCHGCNMKGVRCGAWGGGVR